MNLPVLFAPAAEDDLLTIWQHRAAYSIESADALVERLISGTNRLKDYPRSAPIRVSEPMELRGMSAHGHILFYVIDDDGVTVVRVLNARQNWRDWLIP